MDIAGKEKMKNLKEDFLKQLYNEPDLARALSHSVLPDGFSDFLSAKIKAHKNAKGSLNYLYFMEYLGKLTEKGKEIIHTDESFVGQALYKNSEYLKTVSAELVNLSKKIGNENIFSVQQWIQILAFIKEFRPDSIIEFGSSSRFSKFLNKAAELAGVISRKYDNASESILVYFFSQKEKDFLKLIDLLKKCRNKKHAVIFHGYCDKRVLGPEHLEYSQHKFIFNDIISDNLIAPSVVSFISRNNITFFSADYSLYLKANYIRNTCNNLFDIGANWRWITLNEKNNNEKIVYPQ